LRVATIDIGTNTVLLLIVEVGDDGSVVPIVDRAEITRLGQGVDRSRELAPEAIERTLACLSEYAAEIAKCRVDRVGVVGTSAMRDAGAANANDRKGEFIERAASILGVEPRVVSGDQEASLAFAGGLFGLGLKGELTAFDVGGGSTEIIRGEVEGARVEVHERTSLDVGSVRLYERHVRTDPPSASEMGAVRAAVFDQLRGLAPPTSGDRSLVGMAGTVTTLAAVARGIDPYDPKRVHGMRLGADEIAATSRMLTALPVADRKKVRGLDPKRADVIPVGAAIVEAVIGWAKAGNVIVSDRGVRWGVALELSAEFPTALSSPKTGISSKKGA
jgi:exopolyphosphatase/guanosine-5'-triphosphate,3'-diphosphate pyrophosphatase